MVGGAQHSLSMCLDSNPRVYEEPILKAFNFAHILGAVVLSLKAPPLNSFYHISFFLGVDLLLVFVGYLKKDLFYPYYLKMAAIVAGSAVQLLSCEISSVVI